MTEMETGRNSFAAVENTRGGVTIANRGAPPPPPPRPRRPPPPPAPAGTGRPPPVPLAEPSGSQKVSPPRPRPTRIDRARRAIPGSGAGPGVPGRSNIFRYEGRLL